MGILGTLDKFKIDILLFMHTGYRVLLPVLYTLGISFLTIDIMLTALKTGFGLSQNALKTIGKKVFMGVIVILVIMPVWMDICTELFTLSESVFNGFMSNVMAERTWQEEQSNIARTNPYLAEQIARGRDLAGKEHHINLALDRYQHLGEPSPFVLDEIYFFCKALIDPIKEGISFGILSDDFISGIINGLLWIICWVLVACILFISLGIFLEFFLMSFLLGVMLPFTLLENLTSGIKVIIKPLFLMLIKIIAYVSIFCLFFGLLGETARSFMKDGSGVRLTQAYITNSALVEASAEELQNIIDNEVFEERLSMVSTSSAPQNTFSSLMWFFGKGQENTEKRISETMLGDIEKFKEQIALNKYMGMFEYVNFEPSLTIMLLLLLTFLFLARLNSLVQGLTGGVSDFNLGREGVTFMSQSVRTISMASVAIRNPITRGIGKTAMHGASEQTHQGRGLVGKAYIGAGKAVSAIRGTKTK